MPDGPLSYPDPPLGDGRVSLRRWREDDVECIRLAGSDPAISQSTTVPTSFTSASGIAFIHRQWSRAVDREGLSQAIVEARSDRAIGLLWLALRPRPRVGGLGYWIVPRVRGCGSATAAVRLAVPWAFDALNLHRLEAWVQPENASSQRVLLGAGFEEEGRVRDLLTVEGEAVDALMFAAIPSPNQSS